MSEHSKIREALDASFEDFKLSKEEKYSLRDLLASLDDKYEMLAFTRNAAFDIYREYHAKELDHSLHGITWLEKVIKTIDGVRSDGAKGEAAAYFSPGETCAREIINALKTAKHTIDICVFTISDNQISDAILAAHQAGKKVRVISDNDKADDKGSDVYYLSKQGVPVRLDRSPYHMHHKFAIFDQTMLLNGSFNWTRSASHKNEENITLLYDANLIRSFSETFEQLWSECE